jgi:hypothetical protein
MPTLGEFIESAKRNGVTLQLSTTLTVGPHGPVQIRYLYRKQTGNIAVLPDIPDSEVLVPSLVRSLSQQLGYSSTDLGFTF